MEKEKVLLVATVQSHICQFHLPLIDWLHSQGYEVHVAAKNNLKEKHGLKLETPDKVFEVPFERSPFKKENITAYKMLKKIIEENHYKIIHCNTPMGGILARLIGKKQRKKGTKIIYTAHGFHFFKGAPLKNWIIYYPIEKYFSKFTDSLITINDEDYEIAKNKLKAKHTYLVNGVGVNIQKFSMPIEEKEKQALQKELQIQNDDFVFISIGELNTNKNHIMQIKAMEEVTKKYPNVKLFILGNGTLYEEYTKIIKEKGLENNIKLLGYRSDVNKILQIANATMTTSKREGLPVNVMEAMSAGVPVIATKNRGNAQLIKNKQTGFLVDIDNVEQLINVMYEVIENDEETIKENAKEAIKSYSIEEVMKQLQYIYEKEIEEQK